MINRAAPAYVLLELLLVSVIAGSLFVAIVWNYNSYRQYYNARLILDTVDRAFRDLVSYYNINCKSTTIFPAPTISASGALTVTTVSIPSPLPSPFNSYPMNNSIIDPSKLVLQFKPIISSDNIAVTACDGAPYSATTLDLGQCKTIDSGTTPAARAIAINWELQVAFLLSTAAQANAADWQNITGADCLGKLDSSSNIVSCSANGGGVYLMWKRPLGMAYIRQPSILSHSMQLSQQFNMLYTHDRYLEFAYLNDANNSSNTKNYGPIYYMNCPGRG